MHKYLNGAYIETLEDRVTVYTPNSNVRKRAIFYRKDFNSKNWKKVDSLIDHFERAVDSLNEIAQDGQHPREITIEEAQKRQEEIEEKTLLEQVGPITITDISKPLEPEFMPSQENQEYAMSTKPEVEKIFKIEKNPSLVDRFFGIFKK